jgi:hypothetical protein
MNLARIIPTKYDYARILACKNVKKASILASETKHLYRTIGSKSLNCFARESDPLYYKYKISRREAAIWNMITALAKCNCNSSRPEILYERNAEKHAPQGLRRQYLRVALKRWEALCKWVGKNPEKAAKECAPLIAEYAKRDKQRELRKQRELQEVK